MQEYSGAGKARSECPTQEIPEHTIRNSPDTRYVSSLSLARAQHQKYHYVNGLAVLITVRTSPPSRRLTPEHGLLPQNVLIERLE